LASLENNFQARYCAGVGSLLPGSKAFVAFEFDTRCNDSLMRAHMGIQSTIEASKAVCRPSMKRVADIGGTWIFGGRGRYSDTVIGASILTVLNRILTLLDVPESVRQIRGPSGAFEDGDFCA
jgi:hypothetical protein